MSVSVQWKKQRNSFDKTRWVLETLIRTSQAMPRHPSFSSSDERSMHTIVGKMIVEVRGDASDLDSTVETATGSLVAEKSLITERAESFVVPGCFIDGNTSQ